jgi:hypothetical protein
MFDVSHAQLNSLILFYGFGLLVTNEVWPSFFLCSYDEGSLSGVWICQREAFCNWPHPYLQLHLCSLQRCDGISPHIRHALVSSPCSLFDSRHEFEADAYAVALGHGEALASALVKLEKDNASFPTAEPLYSALHRSHPPLIERLRALGGKKKEE